MCFLQDTIEYMTVGVCVHFMKKSFSQTVSEPEFLLSTYNISTDQSKDDYHLVTAGDYVLNTLLVVFVGLFVCLFVCLDVCLSSTFLGLYTLYSDHVTCGCHKSVTDEAY